jgi:hypothetical protein
MVIQPGEVNALRMHGTVGGGFDLRMAFFEHRARLTAGTGCEPGFPVICGAVDDAFPVDVSLGDRSDVANVNSFTQRLSLDGGSGGDLLVPDGSLFGDAKGGTGADQLVALRGREIRLAGEARGPVSLDGGAGEDTAFAHAGGISVDTAPT